jgi:hypothetical protein
VDSGALVPIDDPRAGATITVASPLAKGLLGAAAVVQLK